MQKIYSVLLLIALWMPLSGCVTGQDVPDFKACANLGDEGYCRTYISKKKFTIDNDKQKFTSKLTKKTYTWDQIVQNSVLIPAEDFAAMKSFFDNFCHQVPGGCPNGVGDWQTFANDLGSRLKQK